MLDCAVAVLGLSARAHHRVLKLARTIADLAGACEVGADHVVTTTWEEAPEMWQMHIGAPERLVLALALTQRDDGWQVDGVRVVEGG